MSKSWNNTAASVRQRLLNKARTDNVDFQLILDRYTSERFLYRLSKSNLRERFILKGALLFVIWEGHPHRVTRDVDLLGLGTNALRDIVEADKHICETNVEDDGLIFLGDTVTGDMIREDQEYEGVRIHVQARLSTAHIRLQIDVGFGDAVTPEPGKAEFPTILDAPKPVLRVYPKETVIAEKFQSMVSLGIANSRMKDFYDVGYLARGHTFEGPILTTAIRATFERRLTKVPDVDPLALTDQFASDSTKMIQWNAFLRRVGITDEGELSEIITALRRFLLPPLTVGSLSDSFDHIWEPGGPWRPR